MRGQNFVQCIQNIGDAQFLDLGDVGGKIFPEITQDLAPIDFSIGNAIKLLFQVSRKVILYVATEEGFKEGGDDATLVFGNETLLVEANVAAIPDCGEHRNVGGRPADAEFFELLDDGRFGIPWRRFGEVLFGGNFANANAIALGHGGQSARVLIFLIIQILMVSLEEAVEFYDGAGGTEGVVLAILARSTEIGGCAFKFCAFHLTGNGADPD